MGRPRSARRSRSRRSSNGCASTKRSRPSKFTHILATGYEHSPFPPFHEIAKRKGWKTLTIDCGHDVMLDRPAELAAMLRDAARPNR